MTICSPRPASGAVELARPRAEERSALRVTLQRAKRERAKLVRRLKRACDSGDTARAKGLQHLLLSSFSGRLCAAAEVNPVLKSAERAQSCELVAIASRMNAFRATDEAANAIAADKRNGGWRCLTIFGLERAALQSLACTAIRPFHTPDPRQFAIRGGGHNEAARKVHQGIADGYTWFIGLDIASFYSSIERRLLTHIIPAPARVIEHVICPPPSEAIRIRRVGRALYGLRLAEASQSGISQGSRSSPLIAELVVKEMLTRFAPDIRIINVADDFGIMARTKRDADAITLALTRASARSPAGRFQLRPKPHSGPRRACDGFDFLGYHFRKRRSHTTCRPSDRNETKFNTRVHDLATKALDGSPDALTRLRRYVKAWWGSFPLHKPHLADADFWWARRHVREVVRRHQRAALPLIEIAMEWGENDYAPLPPVAELSQLRRDIRRRHPTHRSRVEHWQRSAGQLV